ncbi:MAG: hypothetical protein V4599_07195, partial [Verrucomicrobiota bacterium]
MTSQRLFATIISLLLTVSGMAQTVIWTDDFEHATAASSGTRTPENNAGEGTPPYASYFLRTTGGDILTDVAYTSFQGSYFWAGEDHDAVTTFPTTGSVMTDHNSILVNGLAPIADNLVAVREQDITWTGINIAGRNNLKFRGLFAALAAPNFDSRWMTPPVSTTDFVIVQYRIDGGPWTDILRFFIKGMLSGVGTTERLLYQETTGDRVGDAAVPLSSAFSEYLADIPGTGTTLDIRVVGHSEAAREEWAVDNFRVIEDGPAVSSPTVTTPTSTAVTHNSATLGGTISATGGADATARG